MPKIRIKEKDLTTNPSQYKSVNGVFLADASYATYTEPTRITEADEDHPFVKKLLAYGAVVYVCDTYSNAAKYLGDRNQYDVKFLLAAEDATATAETISTSDLGYALEIAQTRKDCAVILGTANTQMTAATEAFLSGTCDYITEDISKSEFYANEEKQAKGKYVIPVYGNDLDDSSDSGDLDTTSAFEAAKAWILAYFNSVTKGNAEWLAIAGYKRGVVPGLEKAGFIKEDDLDAMQPRKYTGHIAVNPICTVNPWGPRIWGNRTALPNENVKDGDTIVVDADQLVASSFANIRVLICDLKKALYKASRKYQFEQNNDVLWVNFTGEVNGLLEEMVQSYGIAGYKWIQESTTERAKLCAALKIVPIEPVEDFDLTIELADSLEVAE